jgi:hypothetical protein
MTPMNAKNIVARRSATLVFFSHRMRCFNPGDSDTWWAMIMIVTMSVVVESYYRCDKVEMEARMLQIDPFKELSQVLFLVEPTMIHQKLLKIERASRGRI